jgi:hypothetical protein
MKSLYLHIGMHKTGTTVIQNFLFLNKELLVSKSLNYFSDEPIDYNFANALKEKRDIDFVKKRIRKLKEVKEDNVLLSCEVFIEADHIPELFDEIFMNEGIYNDFDVKIIIYIRRQDRWLESSYLQISKDLSWQPLSFNEYIKQSGLDNYLNRISIWEKVFGHENIILRVYEKQQLKETLFDDFLSIFNIELTEDFVSPPSHLSNIGIDIILAHILNTSKHLFTTQKQMLAFIQKISTEKSDVNQKELFDLIERKAILAKYDNFNKNIASKFLSRKNRILFYDEIKPDGPERVASQEIPNKAINLLTQVVLNQMNSTVN